MKADILFLERNCPHCGTIKARLSLEAVSDDDFKGKDGQELFVFSSQSNAASKHLLEKFLLEGRAMPVFVTHDGAVLTKTKDIIHHLDEQGMSAK
jgi:hypothetical protein